MMLDTIMNHLKESEPVHLVLQTMTVTVMSLSILWLIFYGKDSKWEGGLEFGEDAVAEEAVSSPKAGCKACEDPDTKKMSAAEVKKEVALRPLWELSPDKTRLVRKFVAKNFVAAQEFLAAVGEVAEEKGHHPDLHLESYRNVRVEVYTHAVGGITIYDFGLTDAIDEVKPVYSKQFKQELDARLGSDS